LPLGSTGLRTGTGSRWGRPVEGVTEVVRVAHTPTAVAAVLERIATLEADRPRVRVVLETRHGTLVEQLPHTCRHRVDGVPANQLTGGWSSTRPAPVQDPRHATSADRHLPS
jgi:hypothetical protein